MSLGTALCWASLAFIIWSINPFNAGVLVIAFFYFALFLAILGTFSVLGFLVRRFIIKNDEIVFRHVKKTFRQNIVVSIFVIIALLLLHAGFLAWWNSIILIVLFVAIEGLVFTNRKFSNQDYVA
jgi:hypothetical protein